MGVIFPAYLFLFCNSNAGLVESIIVVDELAKRLGSLIWHYKITAWNAAAENLNVKTNRTHRFTKYKLKASAAKTVYPEKRVFNIHLTPYSSIAEFAIEIN